MGERRLDQAIKAHKQRNPADTFQLNWHAFQLNPDASKTVDKQAYYEQKFGAERTRMMQAHLTKVGAELGIDFAFGGRVGNTRDSHRLVQLGRNKSEAAQSQVMEQVFKAYFEANEDITDRDVLVACGARAGLDEPEVRAWLESDGGGAEVDADVRRAQAGYISGVPNFRINSRYEVRGAEEPAAFLQIFEKIAASSGTAQGQTVVSEQAC